MAYDDGYYYGQCKLVAVVDNTADNGKTVLITTDDNKTYSGTIANKKCEFLLPPRTLYTVQKVSSRSTEFTTKVEAGYGDCILVHLDTGYVEVKQGDIVGLDYIKAATDANLKNKVPEAKAVKELNNSIGDISGFTNDTYDSIGAYIQYCVDNEYLPDINILPLIPTMTSNTAPSGVASASSVFDSETYAYKAFDNDHSTTWHSVENGIPAWVKYKFPSKVCVRKAKIKPFVSSVGTYCRDFVIQGSNDDSNWTNLYSGTNPNGSNADIVVNFANSNKYQYYRCYMPNSYTRFCALVSLQLYGY